MKLKINKLFALALSALLLIGIAPVPAFAAESAYDLWVNGQQFTSEALSIKCGEGTAEFNAESSTLTLTDATVSEGYEYSQNVFALLYSKVENLKVVLDGENAFSSSNGATAIVAESDVDFKGGALDISDAYCGIRAGGSVSFENTDITLKTSSDSIWAGKDIIFDNTEADITATSKFANAIHSDVNGTITINNSDVTAASNKAVISLGGGDEDASKHEFVLNSGSLTLDSESDYAVLFWNYRDKTTGDQKVRGTIEINGGIADINSYYGGTNIAEENVSIGDEMVFTKGKSFAESGNFVIKQKDSLDIRRIDAVPATCTRDGMKEHYADGDLLFEDALGEKPISNPESIIIPATGHRWGEPEYTWADDGSLIVAKVVCLNDENHVDCEIVKPSRSGKEPTCFESGEAVYTATFKNEVFKEQTKSIITEAVGHDWGEWVVQDEPTETESGQEVRVCKRDGRHTEVREIPSLGSHVHNYRLVEAIPATMEKAGMKAYYECSCGDVVGRVTPQDLVTPAIASVELEKTSYVYDGKAKKPAVSVKDTNGDAVPARFYDVSYSKGCTNVGTYTATVTFKINYEGKKALSFKITPKASELKKLTPAKKAFKATWAKVSKQTTGYELQYSLKKTFKGAKTLTKKATVSSATVKGLKSAKTYYVRIRTYKTVSGKKYCSTWSKTLTVKTK